MEELTGHYLALIFITEDNHFPFLEAQIIYSLRMQFAQNCIRQNTVTSLQLTADALP